MAEHRQNKPLVWLGIVVLVMVSVFFGFSVGTQENFPPDEAFSNPSTEEAGTPASEDEILISFKPEVSDAEQQKIENNVQAEVVQEIDQLDTKVLKSTADQDSHEMLASIRREYGDKLSAELNGRMEPLYTPNDPEYPTQWALPKIQAPTGWDKTRGSSSVKIAVLDTGVNVNHPDLKNKLAPGYNVVDDNTDLTDLHGHGTLMMGIAGAQTDNALGIAGVGIEPKISMVRISNNAYGWAYWSDMAEAIIWAADNGAKVLSISFGGTSPSTTVQNAVDYAYSKGVFIAASAGNSNSSTPSYPAAFNHVVSVAATDSNDQKASFSNYGSTIDIASPGVSIKSTNSSGGYSSVSGTSPACPHVAGIAALVLSQQSNLTPDQVESVIERNADDLGTTGRDDIFGWGRINLNKAVSAVSPTPPPPEYGSISGRVTNSEDGIAVVGAQISALKDGKEIANVKTTSNGSFTLINLAAGYYTLIASLNGYESQTKTGVAVTAGKTTDDINFALQPKTENGSISGKVYRTQYKLTRKGWRWYITKKNVAVKRTKVMLKMMSTPRRSNWIKNAKITYTDKNGYYKFSNLPAGSYLVTATYVASFAYQEVHFGAGENAIVNLKLSRQNVSRWIKNVLSRNTWRSR